MPPGVLRRMRPDVAEGSLITILPVVTEVGAEAAVVFTKSLLLFGVGSKPAPVIVTLPPCTTIWGEKEEMLGREEEAVTINEAVLVAVPADVVTEIAPVPAAAGTVTTSCVLEAEPTAAAYRVSFP